MSRNHSFCRSRCFPWTYLGRIVKFIGISIERSENQWWAANSICGVRIWLESCFLSWVLIVDPWVLTPEIPVAASQWHLDCPEPPSHSKPKACAVQANLDWFPDNKRKKAVSYAPRVCAFGSGKTSSRTPLTSMIIFVFGEFGASVLSCPNICIRVYHLFESQCPWTRIS